MMPICGLIKLVNFLISPALLMPTSKTPNLSSYLKLDKLIGTPRWLLKDLGEKYVFPKFCNKFFMRFFNEVLPALPVTAIILADVISLLHFAKRFKKFIVSWTFMIFLLFFLPGKEVTAHPAPFIKAF